MFALFLRENYGKVNLKLKLKYVGAATNFGDNYRIPF